MTTHNFNFLSYQAEAEFSNQTLQTMIAKTERKKLIEEINIDHRQKYWRKIVVHLVTKDEHALWLIVHSSSQAFFFFLFSFLPCPVSGVGRRHRERLFLLVVSSLDDWQGVRQSEIVVAPCHVKTRNGENRALTEKVLVSFEAVCVDRSLKTELSLF